MPRTGTRDKPAKATRPDKPGKPLKLGRNDPCWCGSGKKHKDCHLPIETARRAEYRKLADAEDPLLQRITVATENNPMVLHSAFEDFWGGKYALDDLETLQELDELEHRGSERFLVWFAFNHRLDDGHTLVEQLAARAQQQQIDAADTDAADQAAGHGDEDDDADLRFHDTETRLLQAWQHTRLRPYVVQEIRKGKGFTLCDLFDQTTWDVTDQAVSRRLEQDEVVIAHIVPVGGSAMLTTPLLSAEEQAQCAESLDLATLPTWELETPTFSIAGHGAQLTADIKETLLEFARLHLDDLQQHNPDATWHDLVHERSAILNHFIMALPTEEHGPDVRQTIDKFVEQTRFSLMSGMAMWRSMFVRDEAATQQQEPESEKDADQDG